MNVTETDPTVFPDEERRVHLVEAARLALRHLVLELSVDLHRPIAPLVGPRTLRRDSLSTDTESGTGCGGAASHWTPKFLY